MVLKNFTSNTVLNNYELNANYAQMLSSNALDLIRQNQDRTVNYSKGGFDWFADAYSDSTGRQDSVIAEQTSANFNVNKYAVDITSLFGANYYIITADSISSASDWAVNDCLIKQIDTNKWLFGCTVGTDAIRRAKCITTLFYGQSTTIAPRLGSSYITNCTSIKSSNADDVGKAGYLFIKQCDSIPSLSNAVLANKIFRTSFSMNNGDITVWANSLFAGGNTLNLSGGDTELDVEAPTSSSIIDMSSAGWNEASYVGVATTAGTTASNVSTFTIETGYGEGNFSGAGRGYFYSTYAIVLASTNPILTADTAPGGAYDSSYGDASFTSYGVRMTSLSTSDLTYIVSHTIPANSFPTSITSAILVPMIADWESGNDIQYRITSSTIVSSWLSCSNNPSISEIYPISGSNTINLTIKLIPKTSTPTTGYPAIYGYALRCA